MFEPNKFGGVGKKKAYLSNYFQCSYTFAYNRSSTKRSIASTQPSSALVPTTCCASALTVPAALPIATLVPAARSMVRSLAPSPIASAWRVKGGGIGDFGGGSLEPPRRWLGLALGVPSRPEPPGAP